MKRLSVGLVLMLLCTLSIFAQNKVISVSGRVVESDSKEHKPPFNYCRYPIVLMLLV